MKTFFISLILFVSTFAYATPDKCANEWFNFHNAHIAQFQKDLSSKIRHTLISAYAGSDIAIQESDITLEIMLEPDSNLSTVISQGTSYTAVLTDITARVSQNGVTHDFAIIPVGRTTAAPGRVAFSHGLARKNSYNTIGDHVGYECESEGQLVFATSTNEDGIAYYKIVRMDNQYLVDKFLYSYYQDYFSEIPL